MLLVRCMSPIKSVLFYLFYSNLLTGLWVKMDIFMTLAHGFIFLLRMLVCTLNAPTVYWGCGDGDCF